MDEEEDEDEVEAVELMVNSNSSLGKNTVH